MDSDTYQQKKIIITHSDGVGRPDDLSMLKLCVNNHAQESTRMSANVRVAAVLSFFVVGVATAGNRWGEQVTIDGTSARGTMSNVRGSSDYSQYIGCQVIWTQSVNKVECAAANSAGQTVSCVTNNPGAVDSVHAITTTSYINFSWNASNECVRIQIANWSGHAPLPQ